MPLHRPDGPVLVALAGMILVGAALADSAQAQSDLSSELRTVAAVRLEGRRSVPAKEIRAVLKTRPRSIFPWRERPILRRDYLRADTAAIGLVYRHHGFLDASATFQVRMDSDSSGVVVTYRIQEGPRSYIRSVELEGGGAVPVDQLRRRLYARVGRPFNPAYLIADTIRISEAYQDRGYLPHVTSAARRDSVRPTDVAVRYEVEQGPLYRNGAVYLSSPGQSRVNEKLVHRELLVRPGEVFRLTRLQRSVERLYETGLFSQIQMIPLVDSTNTLIEYDLRVRERKPRWIDAGVGSGTAERFRFTGEWGHRNLLGHGLRGVLASRLAFDGNARFLLSRGEASLLEPWLLRTRTRGLATLYYESRHDRANPDVVVRQLARGVSFSVRHDFGRYARGSLTQDNTYVTQSQRFIGTVADSTRQELLSDFQPSYSTHRIQAAMDRDTRDNPLDPGRGSAQAISGDIAGGRLSGSTDFVKWQAASAWYTPVRRTWVVATRLRGGVIRPFGDQSVQFSPDSVVRLVPLEDRFRIGGVNSLRGYSENEIPYDPRNGTAGFGGVAMFQANAELRIPISGPFGVELFVDAGNVWLRPSYLRAENFIPRVTRERLDPSDVKYVFGAGLRVNLPVGPLRIDLTWSPRPDEKGVWKVAEPQFAIGPTF